MPLDGRRPQVLDAPDLTLRGPFLSTIEIEMPPPPHQFVEHSRREAPLSSMRMRLWPPAISGRNTSRNGSNSRGTALQHTASTRTTQPAKTTTPTAQARTPTPLVKKSRRDAKLELLQGLISRSIRGAGRVLLAASPPSPASSRSPSRSLSSSSSSAPPASPTSPGSSESPALSLPLMWPHPRQFSATTARNNPNDIASPPPRASLQTTPLLSTPARPVLFNANKPLPSPPLESDAPPPAKPVLKLARIMASLTDSDVEKLFSGAPQYFARSEGHFTGAPHPSVAYPWDESLQIRDLSDHIQVEDEAWSNVTAWPHITRRNSSVAAIVEMASAVGAPLGDALKPADDSPAHPLKKRSHFYPRCRERPSMLSIQGLEKGTIGYEAALELAVSDALQEQQFGFDSFGSRPPAIIEARKKLMDPIAAAAAAAAAEAARAAEAGQADATDDNTSGLKYVGEDQILEELIKNGRRYADGSFYDPQQSKAFYNELFHHILREPENFRHISSHHNPFSNHAGVPSTPDLVYELIPQIEALLDILATPNVWIDFSHVEWRVRLGQILWASSPDDDVEPEHVHVHSGVASHTAAATSPKHPTLDERYTERYWLLLQILLSTELLLRLDAITDGDEYGYEYVRPTEVHRFEKVANPSVRWSLILARTWLENIDVVRIDDEEDKTTAKDAESKPKLEKTVSPKRPPSVSSNGSNGSKPARSERGFRHTAAWVTSLTQKLSLIEGRLHSYKVPKKKHVYAMKAKNVARQCRGVVHFAQELKWPSDTIDIMTQRSMNSARVRELLNTKIINPPASEGDSAAGPKPHLTFSRCQSRRRRVVAGLHPGGWLSRSYLSGLMLPGDGLCSLLMATLLEGDDKALQTLGPIAYLGVGFVYGGKSFWSTACVVGRVLAAGAGASECMGWVSSDVVPEKRADGWVNIDIDEVAEDLRLIHRRGRIWGKAAIERQSWVLGDADPACVLPADFVIPYEAVYKEIPPKNTRIELRKFELYSPYDPNRPARKAGDSSIQPAERSNSDATKNDDAVFASMDFAISSDGGPEKLITYNISYDIYFVTAHPCVPSPHVKVVKSPSSPTIQQIDVSGNEPHAQSKTIHATGHPLHKYFKYASIHLTTLLEKPDMSIDQLVNEFAASTNRTAEETATDTPPASDTPVKTEPAVLVIDCITGFLPQPAAHEMLMSPVIHRKHASFDSMSIPSFPPLTTEISPGSVPALATPTPSGASAAVATPATPVATAAMTAPLTPASTTGDAAVGTATAPLAPTTPVSPVKTQFAPPATSKMHHETRRRRFGSDMEILVRALCAERGWNALISRRRRGCLACAIREAGALGWRVVIRVD